MDYSCIHIYGHIISEEIIKSIETDSNFPGNTEKDFAIPTGVNVRQTIDSEWSLLKMRWLNVFNNRNLTNDQYGTKSVKSLMKIFFTELNYNIEEQRKNIEVGNRSYGITYLATDCGNLPMIVVGDVISDSDGLQTFDKCSLDYRAKGGRAVKSPHATMLEYLNVTDNIYGIVSNGRIIRVLRNSGELVKSTYIEFDVQKMIEEDHYNEFVIMFRLIHASRFLKKGDESVIFERYFNASVESGNRIRDGLSRAAQNVMEIIGTAAIKNDEIRKAVENKEMTAQQLHKDLIHFIYKLLFLFIVEDRGLLYAQDDDDNSNNIDYWHKVYTKFYSVGRLRTMSECKYLWKRDYSDLWLSLFETFKLFEDESFGAALGLKPLGSVLFAKDSTPWLRKCKIDNCSLLQAFDHLNQFVGEQGNMVKINYSALDVEEFGSVYEGILELRPVISLDNGKFFYAQGLDRKSTSSFYTRPDLVNSLIKTTLVPVIEEKLKQCNTSEEKVKSLLAMKVCDASSGSGHFVLAMARTIAWYLCVVRTGEDNPASKDYRAALREVIQKCVYAVDYNPDAVELCKVVLWIEGFSAGKPLTFLDHHVRCGNSVVGVNDLDVLLDAIPKDAFKAADSGSGNDGTATKLLQFIRNRNIAEAKQNKDGIAADLFSSNMPKLDESQVELSEKAKAITQLPEETLADEIEKAKRWNAFMMSPQVESLKLACDIYTFAFYHTYTYDDYFAKFNDWNVGSGYSVKENVEVPSPKTIGKALMEAVDGSTETPLSDEFKEKVEAAARKYRYFHWRVEFPEVFAQGGFDAMCGNPPWDKIQMEEEKWFAGKNEEIVKAANQSKRHKLIEQLQYDDPLLYVEFVEASNDIAKQVNFIKNSRRFKLTSVGKLDFYPLFAEHCLNSTKETWGLVLPTGIAINETSKDFFSKLIDENRLISLFDFENKEKIFDIHPEYKFSLLTVGKQQKGARKVNGGFWLHRLEQILDSNRIYTLKTDDFSLLNPNTKNCPVFRTSRDATLTAKIYRRAAVVFNETNKGNPWNINFGSMLNMSTDSYLFKTYSQMIDEGAEYINGIFVKGEEQFVPLYEGKMFYLYNHHYGTWPTSGDRPFAIDTPSLQELSDPAHLIMPWYWVSLDAVKNRLVKTDNEGNVIWEWKHRWLLGFRDITTATTERTFMVSLIPDAMGVGHTATLLYAERGSMPASLLLAMMSSLVFDYVAKQKCGRLHMSTFIVKQLPVLTPDQFSDFDKEFIVPRVYELSFFNRDLQGWADELWDECNDCMKKLIAERWAECNGKPMPDINSWQPEPCIYTTERRATAQAELDAIYAHLYGLTTDELRYILDPEDVCGKGCINETFRVLKDNETKEFGEYRTKRLVMEAWEKWGWGEIVES